MTAFGYGYAPAAGRDTLHGRFADQKVPRALQLKSGLVMERDGGRLVDRFRNRLMIPIARDTGTIVAFGGRALDEGQVPEIPEFAGNAHLHQGPDPLRSGRDERGHSEAQLLCAGRGVFRPGAGLAGGRPARRGLVRDGADSAQARLLKRFTSKVVLSFDPDAAGQGAATRSSELLVAEGFQVNVALLPEGSDPDAFIRTSGRPGVRRTADRVAAVSGVPARSGGGGHGS